MTLVETLVPPEEEDEMSFESNMSGSETWIGPHGQIVKEDADLFQQGFIRVRVDEGEFQADWNEGAATNLAFAALADMVRENEEGIYFFNEVPLLARSQAAKAVSRLVEMTGGLDRSPFKEITSREMFDGIRRSKGMLTQREPEPGRMIWSDAEGNVLAYRISTGPTAKFYLHKSLI